MILAGGQGSRLGGVQKWKLRLGNKPLLDWVAGRLVGQVDTTLVATGPLPMPIGQHIAVPDILPEQSGPLAGIIAAVHYLQIKRLAPDYLLSVSVDTPLFPDDFLSKALQVMGAKDAVVSAYGGQLYPTNGLWRMNSLLDLPAQHLSGKGPKSPMTLADDLDSSVLDWARFAESDPFLNLNTVADLLALSRRAYERD